MIDLLTDGLAGSGREAHDHKEMVAEGLDLAEAEEGLEDGEEEEGEATTTALVKFTLTGYKERDTKYISLVEVLSCGGLTLAVTYFG